MTDTADTTDMVMTDTPDDNYGINAHPWRTLGERVSDYMSIDEALDRIGSRGEQIAMVDVKVDDPFYDPTDDGDQASVLVPNKSCVFSSIFGPMGVRSPNYSPMERREMLELAFELIGLDPERNYIDTIGNVGDYSEKFFAYVRTDDLVIDPGGIADVIERGYAIVTSFDGSLPSLLMPSELRFICLNMLPPMKGFKGIKAMHYRNAEAKLRQAAAAMELAGAKEDKIIEQAQILLNQKGDRSLDILRNHFYRVDANTPQRIATMRNNEFEKIVELYEGPHNAAGFGRNWYSGLNAFTEMKDHFRPVRAGTDPRKTRAETAVLPGDVMNQKAKAMELLLNSVA